ncbi:MAG: hypothetical protein GX753_00855 [Erysipelothrix sp.]|nr:hypothetical protein [Erysipelothrix sp.]
MKVLMILFVVGCGWPLGMMLEDLDFVQQCQRVKVDIHKLRIKRYVELIVLSVLLPFKLYSILILVLSYKRHEMAVNKKEKELKRSLNLQFSMWLRMMEVLLVYNTVTVAIEQSIRYAPLVMKENLEKLYQALLINPQDQETYLNFMKEFGDLNIERAMQHLYRYAYLGNQDASTQLSNLIEDNAENLKEHRKTMFENELNFFSWYGLIPMLLVSITFLGLMFIVLTNIMKGGWQL